VQPSQVRVWGKRLARLPPVDKALLAVAAAGLVGAAILLVVVSDDDGQAARGRQPVELTDKTVVAGGRPRDRAILQRVVGGMRQTTLRRIGISAGSARGGAGRSALTIAFTPVPGASVRRQWEEWIVAGAFSRRLDAAGMPARVDAVDPHGGFTARPRLRGQPDPRPLARKRQAAVLKAIRAAARRSGAEVLRLEVHRPYGTAIALSLAADDPASFLKQELRSLIRTLNDQRAVLEGIYLATFDERRQLAMEWGAWTRNPAGSYWVRRDLANCSPIEQSEPPGTDPAPPCPA
jgi:hypothetical protein